MDRKMPSLLALIGVAAVAGFKNRDKVKNVLENLKQRHLENNAETASAIVPSVARMGRPRT